MVLVASSWVALQKSIDLALEEAIQIDMIFNLKKMKCMIIKQKYARQFLDKIVPFKMDDVELHFW